MKHLLRANRHHSLGWPDALRMFEIRCRAINISERTWQIYCFHFSRFTSWLNVAPEAIDSKAVGAYLEAKKAHGWAEYTLHGAARSIRTLLRFLHLEGVCPAVEVRMPILPKRVPVSFSQDTLGALLKQLNPKSDFGARDYSLFLFYADTGARLTEALNLRITELEIPMRRALLHGKGRKDRYVGFGQATARALSTWLIKRPQVTTDHVFINRYGGALSHETVRTRIKKLTRRAGIARPRLTAHAMRHFFALQALRNGADPRSVQDQLGHSDMTMTMHYISHLAGESVEVAKRASPIDHAGLGNGGKSLLR